jgi:hypothetical protein
MMAALCGTAVSPDPDALLMGVLLMISTAAFSVVVGTTTLKSLADGTLVRAL